MGEFRNVPNVVYRGETLKGSMTTLLVASASIPMTCRLGSFVPPC